MSKTIISLMSGQLLPNYLLIKELAKEGDTIYFVATAQTKNSPSIIQEAYKLSEVKPNINFQEVQVNEEDFADIQSKFEEIFQEDTEYIVNLTGGNKMMSLAAYNFFRDKNATMCYIPIGKNSYWDFSANEYKNIGYRVNLNEYLALCGIEFKEDNPKAFLKDQDYTEGFLNRFLQFRENDFNLIGSLQKFRDFSGNRLKGKLQELANVEGYNQLLSDISFQPSNIHDLNQGDIKYLTGEWFEEYIKIRLEKAGFTGIISGKIYENGIENELDAIFIAENKCFLIECKTILPAKFLTSTTYKSAAIQSTVVKALSANSYVFYVRAIKENGKEADNLSTQQQRGENMKVRLFGKESFTDEEKFKKLIAQIKEDAGLAS